MAFLFINVCEEVDVYVLTNHKLTSIAFSDYSTVDRALWSLLGKLGRDPGQSPFQVSQHEFQRFCPLLFRVKLYSEKGNTFIGIRFTNPQLQNTTERIIKWLFR